MDEWRERLRNIVADWGLSPEEQSGIIDELEQHLEQEFNELRARVGDVAAQEHILAEVNDPALREVSVRSRHHAEPSVEASMSRTNRLSNVIMSAGMIVALIGMFFPRSPLKGWTFLIGFGLVSIPWLFGLTLYPPRQRQLALGAYFFVMALVLGGPLVWPAEAALLPEVLLGPMLLTVAWVIVESIFARRIARISGQSSSAVGLDASFRLKVYLIAGTVVLLALVLPEIVWK